jgi:N utilization substance protein B
MNRRRAARFGAIQALYQAEMSGTNIEQVIAEFQTFRLADLLEPMDHAEPPLKVDQKWFRELTEGAWQQAEQLDPAIAGTLAPGWTMERLGYLLRAFLRAGAYELAARPDVPVKVVIHEYVELAHAFLNREDAGFINAVLDRLADRLRPGAAADTVDPAAGTRS